MGAGSTPKAWWSKRSAPREPLLHLNWAVVNVDAQGNVRGGGFPGGWKGRKFDGVYGTNGTKPLES